MRAAKRTSKPAAAGRRIGRRRPKPVAGGWRTTHGKAGSLQPGRRACCGRSRNAADTHTAHQRCREARSGLAPPTGDPRPAADRTSHIAHCLAGRPGALKPKPVVIWLGYAIWWEHPGAELGCFFASLAVAGTWGDQPPSGVVGGAGPRVTRRCPRRCRADLCLPLAGPRRPFFFSAGFPQR
jgi:hypothetical protein